jgi:rSAM/selenodomain-associated transferase 1
MARNVIAALMRHPEAGKVKTRLAQDIGASAALAAYEELAATTLANLPSAAEAEAWVFFTPAGSRSQVIDWLEDNVPQLQWAEMIPQCGEDLGERLWAAAALALASGDADTLTLIGTDCPRIRPEHFRKAWDMLQKGCDVVYGPADDGGYYLQAIKAPTPDLFFGLRWSASDTLAQCLERAAALGLSTGLLERLGDVDTAADWAQWQKERPPAAPATVQRNGAAEH